MKNMYKLLLILFLIPLAITATDKKGKYTKSKTINKEFKVTKNATLNVNNKFGNIDIITWNENKIVIDVTITTSGNDESNIEKRLEQIDVNFNSSSTNVSAKTIIEKNTSSWSFWGKKSNVSMQINYIIKMPVTNNVDLNNDYGSISLDKLEGNAKIDCDYGKLNIGELWNSDNKITIDYTNKSTIEFMEGGEIDADYSTLHVEKAVRTKLNADYSHISSVGKLSQTQIIATNIDVALIVQSVNRDFNINRIERYLTICNSSKIEPIVVLSKIDLIEKSELENILERINKRMKDISIIAISNQSQIGLDKIKSKLTKGKTYCLLGSSGVGKSTLINNLVGEELMITGEISESIDRGKHITTHRELIVTEYGILIDNPGMREVGIADSTTGLEMTFETIVELSKDCKFNNCTHTTEIDCAVLEAISKGEIDTDSYENYLKMEKEKEHFESTVAEKRKKDKDFGKMIKHFKKARKSNKF